MLFSPSESLMKYMLSAITKPSDGNGSVNVEAAVSANGHSGCKKGPKQWSYKKVCLK